MEIPKEGLLCDLLWSDPDEAVEEFAPSPRGAGVLFGKRPLQAFVQSNGLSLVVRSHQLVNEGFQYLFDEQLVTIWSAPNYCYRCGNAASVLSLSSDLQREVKIYTAVPDDQRQVPAQFRPLPAAAAVNDAEGQ